MPTAAKRLACLLLLPLVLLGGCTPLQTINALTSASGYQRFASVAYGEHARQQLDIYVPRERTASAPVVVFFYGGSWRSGQRSDYAFVAAALAERGIITVIADYRLYPEVRYPAFLEDAAQAVVWTTRHIAAYGGDPNRLFLMGHSAGAYNAAMVALDARWLQAQGVTPTILRGWIGLAGPYDFLPIRNTEVQPVFFYPDTPPASQPIRHVSHAAPPALLIAPVEDDLVDPVRNTGGLAQRLRELEVPVTLQYFSGVSHASLIGSLAWPLRSLAPTLEVIDAFIQSTAPSVAAAVTPSTTPALTSISAVSVEKHP